MSEEISLEPDTVLDALRAHAPRALHLAEICSKIGISPREKDVVRDILDDLRGLHLVKEMPGLRFRITKEASRRGSVKSLAAQKGAAPHDIEKRSDQIVGRLTMNAKGFGFVSVETGGPDVFIPPPHVGLAFHGDRVVVDVRPSPKGREGTIVQILERGLRQLTGVFHRSGRHHWIVPDDPRIPSPLAIDGDLPEGIRPGLHVTCEMVRHPRHRDETALVRVVSVLGAMGVTAVEVAKIKIRENVVEEFPKAVQVAAQQIPTRVLDSEIDEREDLRGIPLVTIDPPDARDHDDAVWAERLANGSYRILIAIADVSHYVQENTAIDTEAIARGTSIYLPDRAIPMLPREISSTIASLVPGEDRLTLAVEVEMDTHGEIVARRYIEGVMRSRARLTYGGVALALGLTEDANARSQPEAASMRPLLEILFEVATILRKKRMRRGALDFDLPEARVVLHPETGEPLDVYRSRRDPGIRKAYNMIEEMMLLANEVVAEDFMRLQIPAIYRVHGKPNEEKVAKFAELATALGYALDPETAENPRKLQKFLKHIEGTEHAQGLGYLLLRAMQQATYDTTNIGHFGLAAKDYVHFTSPIRRYPDLTVHRTLRAHIRGVRVNREQELKKLQYQASESSRLERRAMVVERDVVDLYRAVLMRDRVGEVFEGSISSFGPYGFYVAFDSPYIEALVPLELLVDDFYELDDLGLRLSGANSGRSFELGDRIRVRIEQVSIEDRKITVVPEDIDLDGPRPLHRPPRSQRAGERERLQARKGGPNGRGRASGGETRGGAKLGSRTQRGVSLRSSQKQGKKGPRDEARAGKDAGRGRSRASGGSSAAGRSGSSGGAAPGKSRKGGSSAGKARGGGGRKKR